MLGPNARSDVGHLDERLLASGRLHAKDWDEVAAAAAVRFEEAAHILGRVIRCLLQGDALVLLARQLLVAFVLRRRATYHHGGMAA